MAVVMAGVVAEHVFELTAAEDEESIEAVGPDREYPALGVGVRVRRLDGCADHGDPFAVEDVIEAAAELGVAIMDEEASGRSRSSIALSRLRACWATQAPVGVGVLATNSTPRLSSEMKKST